MYDKFVNLVGNIIFKKFKQKKKMIILNINCLTISIIRQSFFFSLFQVAYK